MSEVEVMPLPRRNPYVLELAIAALKVETNPRYRRRDVTGDGVPETWCNHFAHDVAKSLGIGLPLRLANAQHAWLKSDTAKMLDWRQASAEEAQAAADRGEFVVAVWTNPAGAHGHIAVVVPSKGQPGVWIAQAGASNFGREPLALGFGRLVPEFFAHP